MRSLPAAKAPERAQYGAAEDDARPVDHNQRGAPTSTGIVLIPGPPSGLFYLTIRIYTQQGKPSTQLTGLASLARDAGDQQAAAHWTEVLSRLNSGVNGQH